MKTRVTLFLEDDAAEQLAALASERKRGEYVSRLVRMQYERENAPSAAFVAGELRALAASLDFDGALLSN